MTAQRGVRERVRHRSGRLLNVAGNLAIQASRRIAERDGATLVGDRSIEWSFCLARLADGPGTTLDFGADIGFLSLAAAQRKHDVLALDRMPPALEYTHPCVTPVQGDILDRPLEGRRFDQIINCSSIEHVGLAGRYGSFEDPNGDLKAMAIMRDLLDADGRMIVTIPVGGISYARRSIASTVMSGFHDCSRATPCKRPSTGSGTLPHLPGPKWTERTP